MRLAIVPAIAFLALHLLPLDLTIEKGDASGVLHARCHCQRHPFRDVSRQPEVCGRANFDFSLRSDPNDVFLDINHTALT